ncbi:hypothetical protein G6F66_014918 [Rhizopus arrhizus]|nr:hypothetical protein G6F66_014918 [Rhizopus arrhizus]
MATWTASIPVATPPPPMWACCGSSTPPTAAGPRVSARRHRPRSRRCTGIARPATTRSHTRSVTCRARGMTSPPIRAPRPMPMAMAIAMSRRRVPAGARSWPTTAPAAARA